MTLYLDALARQNKQRPPVWFMRQAGRYHEHYQRIRSQYSFVDVCKMPDIACETTMGPIEDFDFDAAILFSDILFPLEAMGIGLDYAPGPQLSHLLRDLKSVEALKDGAELATELSYQGEALRLIRTALPQEKGLIGFVGAPLTLYYFGVEGSHKKDLSSARAGLTDGRYTLFCQKLEALLVETMLNQALSGAEAIALFDTCAGDLEPNQYEDLVVPVLQSVMQRFKQVCPDVPLIYYSKGTDRRHWDKLEGLPISCLGVDWRTDICDVLTSYGDRWAIQGNVDPDWLFLPSAVLEARLREYFKRVLALPAAARQGWVCGLGHGVLPKTPEENVKLFIKLQREMFA